MFISCYPSGKTHVSKRKLAHHMAGGTQCCATSSNLRLRLFLGGSWRSRARRQSEYTPSCLRPVRSGARCPTPLDMPRFSQSRFWWCQSRLLGPLHVQVMLASSSWPRGSRRLYFQFVSYSCQFLLTIADGHRPVDTCDDTANRSIFRTIAKSRFD